MIFARCDGCDKDLPLGSTKYRVDINITSDFDGFLPDYPNESDDNMADALCEASSLSGEEAENQVHQEIRLTLCKACRDRLLDDLTPYSDGGVENRNKIPVRIQ